MMGGTDGLQRRRVLEPERCRLRPELVVGGVEVAAHHARHHRAPGQVDHPVFGSAGEGVAIVPRAAHLNDAAVLDHHDRVRSCTFRVEHRRVEQDQPSHTSPPYRAAPASPVPSTIRRCR
jgi:hypothetical protein